MKRASPLPTFLPPRRQEYLRLHVGIGDGQGSYESGILFRTSSDVVGKVVTPDSMFSGSDGRNWDDITFTLTASGLTGYPGLAVISHNGSRTRGSEGLPWLGVHGVKCSPRTSRWLAKDDSGVDIIPQGWQDIPTGIDPLDFILPFDLGEFKFPPPDLIPFEPELSIGPCSPVIL